METRYRVDAEELQHRIRLASAYKRQTGGELLPESLFDALPSQRWRPKPRKPVDLEAKARKTRIENERRRRAIYGLTYGISVVSNSNPQLFRVAMSRAVLIDPCPIVAAMARNKYYAKMEPGEMVYQIPLEAVHAKWGCRCGKHKMETK